MRIRRFRRGDLEGVAAVEQNSFSRDAFPRWLFLELMERCGPLFVVAEEGDEERRRVVGYAVAEVTGRRAEIVSIAVDSRARGRGTGSRMLGTLLARLRRAGVRAVFLTVRVDNVGAQRLYRRFGFLRARIVRGYYRGGADGVRMRLRLAGDPAARVE